MSSDADAAAAAATALFGSLYTESYCQLASSVFFIYDTFITLDREAACFWHAKRISGASFWFFANKWIAMPYYAMLLVDFASFVSDKAEALEILQFVPGAAFSALRAYVLSRSKRLGLLVAAMSLAPAGVNLVQFDYQISGENFPPFGCLRLDNTTAALNFRLAFVFISRVPLITADVLLIYITWYKLSNWDALQQSKRLKLSDVLFRGGTIYFCILFILNVLHLVLSATAIAGNGSSNNSLITQFTAPITAILISRFLIALQEANQMIFKLDSDDPLYSSRDPWDSTPSFISSIGGFIHPAQSAQSDGDGSELQVRFASGRRAAEEEEREEQAQADEAVRSRW
ncbi:hypothetical protein K466DRAFT_666335 [Polyporus arcularius HHB13444]|uniref:DUF6533 domain-containing protein n=1 Tax=Polyporus arcularius HHB13444 TaxID=1314778 RepID=A0A5C3NZ47_9APHY|nr:hypothetical protein K466DRAFT_666335 [Polyporus arcularius HHB13444]